MPDVPALAETLPGFEMGIWVALFAPAGTPPAIVARIDTTTRAVLALPAVQDRLAGIGAEAMPLSAAGLTAYLTAEIERWAAVVRAARITAD